MEDRSEGVGAAQGAELFERAAGAGGQLLRVERQGERGAEGLAAGFLLTFDVGHIWLRAEAGSGRLVCEHVASSAERPDGLGDASEEEPWWRILGNPIVRVAPGSTGGLRLQFRQDADDPRVVVVACEGGAVAARLAS